MVRLELTEFLRLLAALLNMDYIYKPAYSMLLLIEIDVTALGVFYLHTLSQGERHSYCAHEVHIMKATDE